MQCVWIFTCNSFIIHFLEKRSKVSFKDIDLFTFLAEIDWTKACRNDCQGSTLAVFRYPENPRFPDGIPDSPEQ